jgi:N-methylhydantoinase B/oxoprolinase/acetone carboxylase alpha subunit
MRGIQDNAEKAVRDLLRGLRDKFRGLPLQAIDYMVDGSRLSRQVKTSREEGSATFDFTSTAREVSGSLTGSKPLPAVQSAAGFPGGGGHGTAQQNLGRSGWFSVHCVSQ